MHRAFLPLIAPGSPSIWAPWPYVGSPRILARQSAGAPVRIDLFDATGRRVRTLRDPSSANGQILTFGWDGLDSAGRPLPAGVYLARLSPGRPADATRVLVLR